MRLARGPLATVPCPPPWPWYCKRLDKCVCVWGGNYVPVISVFRDPGFLCPTGSPPPRFCSEAVLADPDSWNWSVPDVSLRKSFIVEADATPPHAFAQDLFS